MKNLFALIFFSFTIVLIIPKKLSSVTIVNGGSQRVVISEQGGGNEEYTITVVSGTVHYLRMDAFRYPKYRINGNSQDTGRIARGFAPPYDSIRPTSGYYVNSDSNLYFRAWWHNPSVGTTIRYAPIFSCTMRTNLTNLDDTTRFPIPSGSIPSAIQRYLVATSQTQSDSQIIRDTANFIKQGCSRVWDVVTKTVWWVRERITYDTIGNQNAVSVLRRCTGHCVGFSHLMVALLKANGIPSRLICGVSPRYNYRIPGPSGGWIQVYSNSIAGHAWVEVYYPHIRQWVAYDPQRFIHYTHANDYVHGKGQDLPGANPITYWHSYSGAIPTYSFGYAFRSQISESSYSMTYLNSLPRPFNRTCFARGWPGGTSVDEYTTDNMLPMKYRLLPNRPNPFQYLTQIAYQLAKESQVSLKIYDVSGRHIRTLAETKQPAGYYSVFWDGKDESGQRVSKGIYFCLMKTEDFKEIRKMVLTK